MGNNKERDEETFVYSQEGEKKNIEEIYQKTDRVDFSFWYGTDMLRGKKEEMEQEELLENSGIMEKPIIGGERKVGNKKYRRNQKRWEKILECNKRTPGK